MSDVSRGTFEQQALTGIRRARSHAVAIDPEWSETALVLLQAYAATRRYMDFTSEDFRRWATARGLSIPVPKALGHTFRQAAKRGVIKKVGFGVAIDRHGSPTALWRAL